MKLKNFAIAALFAVAGSAFATDYNEPLDGSNNLGTPVAGQASVNGLFSDTYSFQMPFAFNVTAGSVYGISDVNTVFSSVYLENLTTNAQTPFMSEDGGVSWNLAPTSLPSGNYMWHINGNADAETYYGAELSVTVSAVPEPETYAMMLAGLGLVGFAARRRASK